MDMLLLDSNQQLGQTTVNKWVSFSGYLSESLNKS